MVTVEGEMWEECAGDEQRGSMGRGEANWVIGDWGRECWKKVVA